MRKAAKSSLEDIAKQAAVSRPLIYRKFKSKEEIFGAVLEDLLFRDLSTARQQLSVQHGDRFKQVSSHISAKVMLKQHRPRIYLNSRSALIVNKRSVRK